MLLFSMIILLIFLRPYSSSTPVSSSTLAQVKVYHKSYWRPPSNFNPTLMNDGTPIPYPYDKLIQEEYLPLAASTSSKLKILPYNT